MGRVVAMPAASTPGTASSVLQKPATQERLNPENLQKAGRHAPATDSLRLAVASEVPVVALVGAPDDRERVEAGAVLFPIQEYPACHNGAVCALACGIFPKIHKSSGLIVRQRLEQHAIDDA